MKVFVFDIASVNIFLFPESSAEHTHAAAHFLLSFLPQGVFSYLSIFLSKTISHHKFQLFALTYQ